MKKSLVTKYLGIISISLLLNMKSFAQESCTNFIEMSWWYAGDDGITIVSKESNPGWARFEFKSTSDKDITITSLHLETADGKEVVNTPRNVFIRSYGKAHSMMFSLVTLNLDVVKTGGYRCIFGKQLNEKSKKNVEKNPVLKLDRDNKSEKFKFTFKRESVDKDGVPNNAIQTPFGILEFSEILILFIISAVGLFLVFLNLKSKKNRPKKNKNTRSKTKIQSENLISKVWSGNENMAKTFWLYCIIFGVIVGIGAGAMSALYGNYFYIIAVIYIFWSNIGLWNSSTKYKLYKLKNRQTYGWSTLAKVYVVFNFLTTVSQAGLMFGGNSL